MADNGFWAQAQAHPDRVAIVDDGGAQPTFGELFARQNRTANALRAHGLTVGDCVAGLLWNQPQFLELTLASGH
jgi:acyl-CoA synthetase (AMP-forming)/AMP-acid ligase II